MRFSVDQAMTSSFKSKRKPLARRSGILPVITTNAYVIMMTSTNGPEMDDCGCYGTGT